MKSVFLSIVTILTCSGCVVVGDLEFYPDYKRSEAEVSDEEWIKEPRPDSQLQQYLQEAASLYRAGEERSSYPYGALRHPKPNKENDNLWRRTVAIGQHILNRNEKSHEPSRKQYFKISPSGKDPRASLERILQDRAAIGLLSRLMNNQFTNNEEFDDGTDTDYVDFLKPEEYDSYIDEEVPREEEERSSGQLYEVDNVYNPTEFAAMPSDPNYFSETGRPNTDIIPSHLDTSLDSEMESSDNEKYLGKIAASREEKYRHSTEEGAEVVAQKSNMDDTAGMYIIAVIAGISAAATVGLIAFAIGWYNLQKHVKNASDVDYPAYGVTGPNKDISPSGDRRLAQSAQMYHYQHQKQQIIAMERAAANERHGSVSEAESDEENEEGDYTVYECPGLAPTGEMEVKNPLFQDDPTPAQTPAVKASENGDTVPKK